jgi:hypothetical protein
MKLLPDTVQRHQCRQRERCAKRTCEKGDARRYPQHTLAPDPEQDELDLQPPLYGESPYKGDSHG